MFQHRYDFTLRFPAGLHAGEGKDLNALALARDGANRAVLRGSAIAGVLRHAMARGLGGHEWAIFGQANEGSRARRPSSLEVPDVVLDLGDAGIVSRMHNALNRHTGVPIEGGLFELESCPPGTRAGMTLWLRESVCAARAAFERELAKVLRDGLAFGGNSNRGIGFADLETGGIRVSRYDLSNVEEHARYLDDHLRWRAGDALTDGSPLDFGQSQVTTLTITLRLRLPRGQDILIGDHSDPSGPRPQRVVDAAGKEFWRLPGSALRGSLRSWTTRFAAMDDELGGSVADSVSRHEEGGMPATGENVGWCFLDEELRGAIRKGHMPPKVGCPVADLFGSLIKAGRVHISDAYAPIKSGIEQLRAHVAIDRITGGANDQQLFQNWVLVNGHDEPLTFEVRVRVRDVRDEDRAALRCFADSIRALDSGVIRIGSSKASGRLSLVSAPIATGPGADLFSASRPTDVDAAEAEPLFEPRVPPEQPPASNNNAASAAALAEAGRDDRSVIAFTKALRLPGKIGTQVQLPLREAIKKRDVGTIRLIVKEVQRFRERLHEHYPDPKQRADALAKLDAWLEGMERILPVDRAKAQFHNPYTFIPFARSPVRPRKAPTPLTAEEAERSRLTGTLTVRVLTTSPLLSQDAEPSNPKDEHPEHQALRVNDDIIVPATSVRGSLRTLLTILTSGTLGYVDEDIILRQGRDLKLPLTPPPPGRPEQGLFLGLVRRAGSKRSNGEIELGTTLLVWASEIQAAYGRELPRPGRGSDNDKHENLPPIRWLWARLKRGEAGEPSRDEEGYARIESVRERCDAHHPWMVKLSGMPVGNHERKREAVFLPSGSTATIPRHLWHEYSCRNRACLRERLQGGDLVWLEPASAALTSITQANEIRSLQWARLGRRGTPLTELVGNLLPDSQHGDLLVDEITSLFGQVGEAPKARGGSRAPSFAGRVRPENLVFENAAERLHALAPLPPLSSPRPGCLAFYRNQDNPDALSPNDPLRGYKVYRASAQADEDAPWLYHNQPVFSGDLAATDDGRHRNNRSVELLGEAVHGHVRIAFRSLDRRELALLLLACSLPWRLGGGKPLGLGCCRAEVVRFTDEFGEDRELPAGWETEVEDVRDRVRMWLVSQVPVPFLRYPRARKSGGKTQIGGHIWFSRHARPRFPKDISQPPHGLTPYCGHEGQLLPKLDPEDPHSDALWGYDLNDDLVPPRTSTSRGEGN